MVHIVVKSGEVFNDGGDGYSVMAAFSNPVKAKTFAEGQAKELFGNYRPMTDFVGFENPEGSGRVRVISKRVA